MGGKKKQKQMFKKQKTHDKNSNKKGKGAKKTNVKKTRGKLKSTKSRIHVDIFTEPCMENAYYICHNVQDVLKYRGFPWPEAVNKKKKGKKKK